MSNVLRNRVGETNTRLFATPATTAIEIGDLVYLDGSSHNVKPASAFPWTSNTLALTQVALKAVFAGVAQDARSSSDAAGNILVATTGVAEYPIVDNATAADPGTFYGVAQGTGNNVLSQKLVVVANATEAIGKAAQAVAAHATTALVEIVGSVTLSGVQTIT